MDHLALRSLIGATRRASRSLLADGIELVEAFDEPAYVSVKCRDPDGYIVEAYWEPTPS